MLAKRFSVFVQKRNDVTPRGIIGRLAFSTFREYGSVVRDERISHSTQGWYMPRDYTRWYGTYLISAVHVMAHKAHCEGLFDLGHS